MLGITIGGYWDNSIRTLPPDVRANLPVPYTGSYSVTGQNPLTVIAADAALKNGLRNQTGRYWFVGFVTNFRTNWWASESKHDTPPVPQKPAEEVK
jgi:hypothetical protein